MIYLTTGHSLQPTKTVRSAMKGMGPNDMPSVVWAIAEFFKFSSCFFYLLTYVLSNYRYNLQTTKTGRLKMMRTGPNDASGVVWALGEFFFCIIAYRYYTPP